MLTLNMFKVLVIFWHKECHQIHSFICLKFNRLRMYVYKKLHAACASKTNQSINLLIFVHKI